MAALLLNRGADINLTFDGGYGTALAAAARGKPEVATLLLNRGANPDLTNHFGRKPGDLAELLGYNGMVSLLDSYSTSKQGTK